MRKLYWLGAGAALVTVVAVAVSLGISGVFDNGAHEEAVVSAGQIEPLSPQDGRQPGNQDGTPGDSIAVHGHWTIDVLDPDGTKVSSNSFTNAYTGGGNLPRLLSGERVVGTWIVEFQQNLCANDSGSQVRCEIHEGKTPFSGPHIFPNLTVSVPNSGANQNKLVLTGSATANSDGQVTSVRSQIRTCGGNVSPESCTGAAGFMAFTSRSIPVSERPSVVAGQQVAVTVVIDFN